VKRKRFSVEQMVAVLNQAEVGVPVVEVCRRVGMLTFYLIKWLRRPPDGNQEKT
jgi:putative transposase